MGLMTPGGRLKTVEVYNGSPNNYLVNIDVKSKLPTQYKFLKMENFGITTCNVYAASSVPSTATRGPVIRSYSPDTGILQIHTGGDSLPMKLLIVNAWYV